jgi:N-carbamoyl-L-amino-acid hydrolase
MRAPTDRQRDALAEDVLQALARICERRGLRYTLEETVRASAAPSHQALQTRWEKAMTSLGLPLHHLAQWGRP